jgi:hypothetical protein
MSSKDYMPSKDSEFNLLQDNVHTKVLLNATAWGIPEAAITALDPTRQKWNSAYGVYSDPDKRTPAVIEKKNEARKNYLAALRPFIQGQIMHNPKVADSDRLGMGLPTYDHTPTPAEPPTTRPEIEIDFDQIARHTLHVRDTKSKTSGKPPHVAGFEIWRLISETEPKNYEELQLAEMALHSPHTLIYSTDERSKKVWYAARWVSTRGDKGPWSELVPARIS